jgi:hypothetical protein
MFLMLHCINAKEVLYNKAFHLSNNRNRDNVCKTPQLYFLT